MAGTTNPTGIQRPTPGATAGGEQRQGAQRRHRVEGVLWLVGLCVFVLSCFIMHAYHKAYPFDIAVTQAVQSVQYPAWARAVIEFPSQLNNPQASLIALSILSGGMLLLGVVFWRLKKVFLPWFQAAVFFVAAVMSSTGVNVLCDILVNRPRPNPQHDHIQVHTAIVPFPTYPSGHTEHDVVYYGFLLYLSFTRPVREWRYRWVLLPFQLYAVFDILMIGYSRIFMGDHWVTDVLGGYLEGALLLFLFIFLYRWATDLLARWHARRAQANL